MMPACTTLAQMVNEIRLRFSEGFRAAAMERVDDLAVAEEEDALRTGGDEADVAGVAGFAEGRSEAFEIDESGGQRLVDGGAGGKRQGLLAGIDRPCA